MTSDNNSFLSFENLSNRSEKPWYELVGTFLEEEYDKENSKRDIKSRLKKFEKFHGNNPISLKDLERYHTEIVDRIGQGEDDYAQEYARKIIGSTRKFAKWLIHNQVITEFTADDVDSSLPALKNQRKKISPEKILRTEEREDLLDAANELLKKLILVLPLRCGLRSGEVRSLTVADIIHRRSEPDDEYYLHVEDSKNGKTRSVPMPENVFVTIREYLSQNNRDITSAKKRSLLMTPNEYPLYEGKHLDIFHNIVERSSIERDLKPHFLRATYATQLIKEGLKLTEVSDLLGHEDLDVTYRKYVFFFEEWNDYVAEIPWDLKED
jgi:site-specific recombinase XerD